MRRHLILGAVTALALAGSGLPLATAAGSSAGTARARHAPEEITHLVVIYQENHSFDNLFGGWGRVGNQAVDGLSNASLRKRTQVAQDGTAYGCLMQDDVNLTSPPLSGWCADNHTAPAFRSNFANGPFRIDDFIKATDTTCPPPGVFAANGVRKGHGEPGGCTRDIVHRFYQEQYQLNRGRQNRYVTGSDAVGLTMGTYDTKNLPIYKYLHGRTAPHYVVADRFFQAAFGGSFLNHQYLIAARAPIDTKPGTGHFPTANSVVDKNGMPTSYPLYTAQSQVKDGQLTRKCASGGNNKARACGDFAVNTVQPASKPAAPKSPSIPLIDDRKFPNIGDRMSAARVSWNWYAGGWNDANAGKPGPLFQFHHQPFNYFANYAPGKPGRAHLKDEKDFLAATRSGRLPTVSFVKPYGAENEHPGYASEPNGSDHLVNLIRAVQRGPQAAHTLIVVTYDEFGGQWDHVSPPGQGSSTPGVHDAFGPGTRIPALLISKAFSRSGVDHTVYDTTSIMASIERALGLAPVDSRDARVHDLAPALLVGGLRVH